MILHNGPFSFRSPTSDQQCRHEVVGRDGKGIFNVFFYEEGQEEIFLQILNQGYEKYILDSSPRTCYITDNVNDTNTDRSVT